MINNIIETGKAFITSKSFMIHINNIEIKIKLGMISLFILLSSLDNFVWKYKLNISINI